MEEFWAPVTYLDLRHDDGRLKYEISSIGNVRKTAHVGYKGRSYGQKAVKPHMLDGQFFVKLRDNEREELAPVAFLVAMSFIDNPGHCKYVRHIDGDRSNNSITNLKWCKEKPPSAVVWGRPGRKVRQYTKQLELIAEYRSILLAANTLGIHKTSIRNCCSRRTKTSGGYIWRFVEDDEFYKG